MKAEIFNVLISKLKTSRNAFDKLYSFYFPKIVLHVSLKFGNYELSRDVAQEFFVKLFDINQTEYIKYPNSWVYTVADNIAKNILTKENKYTHCDLDENQFKTNDVYFFDNFGEHFEKLKKLDADEQKIVVMRVVEGYSFLEISQVLHLKYGTIRQKYSRSIKKLKKL